MRLFVLPPDWEGGARLLLRGERARYLGKVLRLGPGDAFTGVDAEGRKRRLEILEEDRLGILLAVGPPEEGPGRTEPLPDARGGKRDAAPDLAAALPDGSPPLPRLLLAIGLLKGEKMDLVIRQAAEAGVAEIIPLLAARSQSGEVGTGRRERWERKIREARQQSGSLVPTRLGRERSLPELLEDFGPSVNAPIAGSAPLGGRLGILLHESPLAATSLHGYLGATPGEIILLVGPEGGFAPEEVSACMAAGFLPLRLPGAVLRAETAALYAVAAVQITLAERPAWNPRP
jgi:16S rRNA (uracil1498-N3)-methyltransferase